MRVSGRENVPMTGPLILACNHVSYMDPLALGTACPRVVHYMAKKELFSIPVLGPLIRSFGAYPVDRNVGAAAAIKRSVEVLRSGGCIGIFPEGTRNVRGDARVHTGVALLASLAGAPVVPAAIVGSGRAARLGAIKVTFGVPMQLPAGRKASREDLAKFTQDVMNAIRALAGEARGN